MIKKKIPIRLIEDHNRAYYFWKKLGFSGKSLIHFDAHMDFDFHRVKSLRQTLEEAKSKEDLIRQLSINLKYKKSKAGEARPNIGNYVYSAMRDGIVSDFYWIVPGINRGFKRSLKKLQKIFKLLFRRDPFETRKIIRRKGALEAKIYKKNFVITTVENLPKNITDAIIDIDTDYFTTDTIKKGGTENEIGKNLPWIWPEEFIALLKKKKMHPCCITIAYSVNGGYTPLIYKFLGDEVAIFFNGVNPRLKEIILMRNKALALFKKGKPKEGIDIMEMALENLNNTRLNARLKNKLKAHLAFILFRCFAQLNNLAQAEFYYHSAISYDKTYRVKDNNYGRIYLRRKRKLKKAEREFSLILSVDKDNTFALSGLANIFMRRKDFKKAKALFKKAYAIDRKNREALLGLSRVELFLKNYRLALRYLKSYRPKDSMQDVIHFLSARAYKGLGMFDKALEQYKLARCFGVKIRATHLPPN